MLGIAAQGLCAPLAPSVGRPCAMHPAAHTRPLGGFMMSPQPSFILAQPSSIVQGPGAARHFGAPARPPYGPHSRHAHARGLRSGVLSFTCAGAWLMPWRGGMRLYACCLPEGHSARQPLSAAFVLQARPGSHCACCPHHRLHQCIRVCTAAGACPLGLDLGAQCVPRHITSPAPPPRPSSETMCAAATWRPVVRTACCCWMMMHAFEWLDVVPVGACTSPACEIRLPRVLVSLVPCAALFSVAGLELPHACTVKGRGRARAAASTEPG